jgi:DNA-binding MltR family transcriptional regulator
MGCEKENFEENTVINQNIAGHNLNGFLFKSDSIIKANKRLSGAVSSKFRKTNNSVSRFVESSTHGFIY